MAALAHFAGQIIAVKIGGNSIAEDAAFLPAVARQLGQLQQAGAKPVLIHGGGPQIDAALREAGIVPVKGPDGRRLTDAATMAVVDQTMRSISQGVSAVLQDAGCRTMLPVTPPVIAEPLGQDYTGKPLLVEQTALRDALEAGAIPVLNSVGQGRNGMAYNINADDYALAVAVALRAARLILATNVMGVWGADKKPLPKLTPALAQKLIADGTIAGGMIPKVESALAALQAGVGGIAIIDGHRPEALLAALQQPESVGTLLAAA